MPSKNALNIAPRGGSILAEPARRLNHHPQRLPLPEIAGTRTKRQTKQPRLSRPTKPLPNLSTKAGGKDPKQPYHKPLRNALRKEQDLKE
jgi:hypothetical protein